MTGNINGDEALIRALHVCDDGQDWAAWFGAATQNQRGCIHSSACSPSGGTGQHQAKGHATQTKAETET